ncbi:permease YjgP/YjgQ family protein [Magnetococcus marinus MC-1]|uniref:Permease YjgP/YjgQ family protein n=1 Tax=Magnetococcus marinus (strain ATCC BAA-1437 / JCM 17883 / MC-1) TaxID=156889 RepID=A0LB30_MAGMM|nr:LPS export ABC transporter permease LptF [Magnetococcus marinus]ABK45173.1 permease YjgP/YjgQ family protein [Magnetococcus marinus MC-1]
MKRLSRYLLTECALTSFTALVVLTTLVLLPQILMLVDLWVNKSVSVSVLGKMVLLIMPKFLVASLPMALLVGILIGLGRLAQDSELIVIKASGISLLRIFYPLSVPIVVVTACSLYLNWFLVPDSHTLFQNIRVALLSQNTFSIKTQTFNNTIPGLTIYVNRQSHGGKLLEGLLIHDERDPDMPVTVIAKSGMLHRGSTGETALLLKEGSRHQMAPGNAYRRLNFSTYDLELGIAFETESSSGDRAIRSYSIADLEQARIAQDPLLASEAEREWHRRFAIPLATLLLGFLAIPLAMQQNQRSGRGFGFIVAISVLILQFILLTLGEAMAKRGLISPAMGAWSPNLALLLFTSYVTYMAYHDRPIRLFQWLGAVLAMLPQRMLQTTNPSGKAR